MTGGTGPPPAGVVTELMLIRLHRDTGAAGRRRVAARVANLGGETLVSAPWGWIVTLPQQAKPKLAADPAVATVGGVQPSGRPIPRIRVPVPDV